jgi:hypothetical protein
VAIALSSVVYDNLVFMAHVKLLSLMSYNPFSIATNEALLFFFD